MQNKSVKWMMLFTSFFVITSCDDKHSDMEGIMCAPRGSYWSCVNQHTKTRFHVPYDRILLKRGPICTWSVNGYEDIKAHHKEIHIENESLEKELELCKGD